jgi:tRNA G18 (ribose-2'-O)-methylase SpoU
MSEKNLRQTSVRNKKPGFKMVAVSRSKPEHYVNTTATGEFEVIVLVSEANGIRLLCVLVLLTVKSSFAS